MDDDIIGDMTKEDLIDIGDAVGFLKAFAPAPASGAAAAGGGSSSVGGAAAVVDSVAELLPSISGGDPCALFLEASAHHWRRCASTSCWLLRKSTGFQFSFISHIFAGAEGEA